MLFTARLAEIDARGLDALVPQEVGQQTQIGVNGQEVFGKAVAEGVGVHQGGIEVQPLRPNTEHGTDAPRGDAAAAVVDKERPDDVCAALRDPCQRLVAQREGDVDAPLFVAFGVEIDEAAAHMLHTKLHQLAHPRTGGGEKAHHEVPTQFAQLSQSPREIEIVGLADDVFDERAPPEAHAFEPPLWPPQREEPTIDGHHALIHGLGRIVLHEGAAMPEQILLVERREARQEVVHRFDIGAHGVGGEVVVDEALLKCRQTGMGIDVLAHKCRDLRGFPKPSYGFLPKCFGSHAIIGNPPYQVLDGGEASEDAAAPIYHKFVKSAFELGETVSMIIPSKWMVGGRSELRSFLEEMKDNTGLAYMKDYRDDRSIFPSAHNDSGICYFRWHKNKTIQGIDYTYVSLEGEEVQAKVNLRNDFCDFVLRDIRVIPILNKVHSHKSERFSSIVSKTRPFGLRKDLFNSPEKYPKLHLSSAPFDGAIKVFGVKGRKGGAKRVSGYITSHSITDKYKAVEQYKLFFTTTYSSDAMIPPAHIQAMPGEICTETFLLIGPFASEYEMKCCSSYMETTFFRFILSLGHGTMQVNKNVFSLLPIQDFSEKSDIKWMLSTKEIDRQLYRKYGLTPQEIAFIEEKVKPMQ